MKIILCIDDSPDRYHTFILRARVRDCFCIISHDPYTVGQALDVYRHDIVGVCLDHDMPIQNGKFFVNNFLLGTPIPVSIVSANVLASQSMKDMLDEYECNVQLNSAISKDWVEKTLDMFGV